MKNYLHLLISNLFHTPKLINNSLFKNNLIHRPLKCLSSHRVPEFQWSFYLTEIREECDWLRLGKLCRKQSTKAYFESTAYIKIILKNHAWCYYWLSLIIWETRY